MWYTFSFHTPSAFTTVAQWNVWERLANIHIYQGIKQGPGDFFYRMKKCLIFAPQDSSIYAAHTSMRYHSTCVPQLRVCSPVGFNRVTNSFVSRETPGPYPLPSGSTIQKQAGSVHPWCWISYLQIMAFASCFWPGKGSSSFPLWAEKQKAASAPMRLHLQISICQKGAKPVHP